MERKLRVLMVLFNLAVANGVSSFVMNYFRKLNHSIVQMDFVVYSKVESPYVNEIQNAGGKIYLIPSIRKISQHIAASKKIIEQGHYDIVHDNILILSYFVMKYAKDYHVPVRILHSHNSKLGETRYKEIRNKIFMPLLLGTVTDRFACSDLAANGMFHDKPYTFIPNVISPQRYFFNKEKRCDLREKYHVDGKFIIGTVARLAYQKNPFYAIDIIGELYKLNPQIEYWWIGDGPLYSQVESKIHQKGLENVIKLLGRRNDTAGLYQAMDMFFLPSLFEGLPVTALEAQATGLPCLVSDTVSQEFVYTDQVSFFSLQDSGDKVCHLIQNIINHKNNESRIVGREKLLESIFSDRNAGRHLTDVYTGILSQKL